MGGNVINFKLRSSLKVAMRANNHPKRDEFARCFADGPSDWRAFSHKGALQ
jgi:hypothetical protein